MPPGAGRTRVRSAIGSRLDNARRLYLREMGASRLATSELRNGGGWRGREGAFLSAPARAGRHLLSSGYACARSEGLVRSGTSAGGPFFNRTSIVRLYVARQVKRLVGSYRNGAKVMPRSMDRNVK